MAEIMSILEEMFQLKAEGGTVLPPKIFFHRNGPRFYSSMVSSAPTLGYAGCKWQSGDPDNPALRARLHPGAIHPVRGYYGATGRRHGFQIGWTGNRTAAASTLAAKHIGRKGAKTIAILGCGLQGRKNIEALKAVLPGLVRCQAYDVMPDREATFVKEMDGRWGCGREQGERGGGSARRRCGDHGGAYRGSPTRDAGSEWLAPGSLTRRASTPDSYVTDEAIAAADLVLTDDRGQIEDARLHEGKFGGVTRIDAELGELVSTGKGQRTSDDQRILVFNLGIALEDLATGIEILKRARQKKIGTLLHP